MFIYPGLHDNLFWHSTRLNLAPVLKILRPGTLHFCRANGKIRGKSAPKHTRAETSYPHVLGPRVCRGTLATNFSIYTTKLEGAGPQILGTGAQFKWVPWRNCCRVNRALVHVIAIS